MRLEELDLTEDKMSVTGAEAEELDETDDTPEADAACESLSMDSPKTNTTIEEKPVVGRGKTFEPLLEEKLAEDQRQQTSSKSPATSKPFLKKFSGLSRFNIKSSEPSNKTKSSPFGSGSTPVRKVTPIKDKKSGSKLLESNAKNKYSKDVCIVSPPRTLRLNPPRPAPAPAHSFHLSDSMENSFCDKLVVQASRQQKDQAELAVFKMLETVTDDDNSLSSQNDEDSLARHRDNSGLATQLYEDSLTSYRDKVSLVTHRPVDSLVSHEDMVGFATQLDEDSFTIELFDKDRLGKDKFLGVRSFDKSRIVSKKVIEQGWYSLSRVTSSQVNNVL